MNRYIPVTDEDRRRMLGVVGAPSIDDLFSGIPVQVRQKKASDLPKALSEPEMLRDLRGHTLGIGRPAPGVDDHELASVPLRVVAHPVPGHPGQVLHDRLPAAEDPVDQH